MMIKEKEPQSKIITAKNDVKIKYSIAPTEFEIQAALYLEIKHLCAIIDNHCEILSEVTIEMDGKTFRFDLMLFRYNEPMCGIEVKKRKWKPCTPHGKQQVKNYIIFEENTEIPVFFCYGMDEVEETINKVNKYIY